MARGGLVDRTIKAVGFTTDLYTPLDGNQCPFLLGEGRFLFTAFFFCVFWEVFVWKSVGWAFFG